GCDRALEEAALDPGAIYAQVARRILLPHLYPAIGAGAAIAFFQSVENFNTTLFTRGTYDTLTVYVFSRVRSGITPTINALALIMVTLTIVGAIWYEITRRRQQARLAALEAQARRDERAAEVTVSLAPGSVVAAGDGKPESNGSPGRPGPRFRNSDPAAERRRYDRSLTW